MKAINETLRELRVDNDLKQSSVAKVIGMTQQQYSRYEKGETELPLRAFFVLADYYGISADYLAGRKGCMDKVPGLDKKVTDGYTAGEILADILALGAEARAAVADYISLQKAKESCKCHVH